jgi:(S)-coclaurine N-methyltransferase
MPYDFVTAAESKAEKHDWIAKYFFTNGTMPSADLFFWTLGQDEGRIKAVVKRRWWVNGTNYGKRGTFNKERLSTSSPPHQ